MAVTKEFFKLLKLQQKKVRLEHHVEFLRSCGHNNVIPDGLQLRKSVNFGDVSGDFKQQWEQVLISS